MTQTLAWLLVPKRVDTSSTGNGKDSGNSKHSPNLKTPKIHSITSAKHLRAMTHPPSPPVQRSAYHTCT